MEQWISSRQLKALTFVSMLCPFLRLLPGAIARQAGSAAWVSAGLSILPTWLLVWMLTALQRRRSMGEQILHCLGRFPGCVVLGVWSLWLLVHSGFLLRSGADRFIATVYPGASPTVFMAVTAGLCLIAAGGSVRSMGRLSELLRPLLLGVILLVLIFSLEEVEPRFLLPVTQKQLPSILRGAALAAEPIALALVNGAFLHSQPSQSKALKSKLWWIAGLGLFGAVFCGVCVGSLGKTYTTAIPYPFFVLARDLSIISGVERIEALVVALWFLPDFVLITVELMVVRKNLAWITQGRENHQAPYLLPTVLTALALLFALTLFSENHITARWSETLIPFIQLFWAYGAVTILLLISHIRKKF